MDGSPVVGRNSGTFELAGDTIYDLFQEWVARYDAARNADGSGGGELAAQEREAASAAGHCATEVGLWKAEDAARERALRELDPVMAAALLGG